MPDKEEQCVPGAQRHAGHRERLTKSWGEGEGWPEGHVPENRWFGPEVFFSLPSGGVWGEGEGDSLRVWGPGRRGWQAGAGDQGGALGGQSLTAARYHPQAAARCVPLTTPPPQMWVAWGRGLPTRIPGPPKERVVPEASQSSTDHVEGREPIRFPGRAGTGHHSHHQAPAAPGPPAGRQLWAAVGLSQGAVSPGVAVLTDKVP